MNESTKIGIVTGALIIVAILLETRRAKAGVTGASALAGKASDFAQKWVGITEVGANKGFSDNVFEQMMKNVGWKSGEEWCMYFTKAVHFDTFKDDRDKIKNILNGSTQLSWTNAGNDKTGTYKQIKSGRPMIGDIAIWQRTTNKSKGHSAIVIKDEGNNFVTVEGNTSEAGAYNGDRVLKLKRPMQYNKTIPNSTLKLLGFIRKMP
jgi:hypothetical protein